MDRTQVGAQLRRLRTSRQCSVSELARRSRVGKGTISELENGRRDVRLETLFALTTALEAPLSSVLEVETTGAGSPIAGASVHAVLVATWTEEGERTEVYRARLTPQAQRSKPHAPGVEETVTVLRGVVRVGPSDRPVELNPGQSLRYPGDARHHFSSVEAEASVLLLMHYPHS